MRGKTIRLLKAVQAQPVSVWYIVSLSMWEYFSYYGMRALLILYLTQKLLFTDQHAYALYGAYTSLVYLTPMLGGLLADRYLGFRLAVVLGSILMIIGHLTLGLPTQNALYIGLAFIVCGYGLFKSNIYCLLGESYTAKDKRRDSGFTWIYVGGNLGAFIAPIITAFAAQRYGWHVGFILAGFGLFLGLLIFSYGKKHFVNSAAQSDRRNKSTYTMFNITIVVISSIIAVMVIAVILAHLWVKWILIATGLIVAWFIGKLMLKASLAVRKNIVVIIFLMLIGIIFWAFDQQGGSSINLFILRNIDRTIGHFTIPAAAFQSVNTWAILIVGSFLALFWQKLAAHGVKVSVFVKLIIGLLILTLGFLILTFGAKIATINGHASMIWPVLGIILIGLSELFIDPVIMSKITQLSFTHSVGILSGIYMLASGSFANYLAAMIASFTSVSAVQKSLENLTLAAHKYYLLFKAISFGSLAAVIITIILGIIARRLLQSSKTVSASISE